MVLPTLIPESDEIEHTNLIGLDHVPTSQGRPLASVTCTPCGTTMGKLSSTRQISLLLPPKENGFKTGTYKQCQPLLFTILGNSLGRGHSATLKTTCPQTPEKSQQSEL